MCGLPGQFNNNTLAAGAQFRNRFDLKGVGSERRKDAASFVRRCQTIEYLTQIE
jgi:hypothetical protein